MSANHAAPAAINKVSTEDASKVFYRFETKDNFIIEMSSEAIKQSKTLSDLASSLGVTNYTIPVNNINGATLRLIAKWCEQHKGEPIPEDDGNVQTNIVFSDWECYSLHICNEELAELIRAADYLDIKRLMDCGCMKIAEMAKFKSPEELRNIYRILAGEDDEATEKN